MQIAILTVSSLSLIASAGSFMILAKMAKEMHTAKTQIEAELEGVKAKVTHNAKVVKAALGSLEF